MPDPDQMHGAGDGYGGEDTPHSPSASKMLGRDLPKISNERLLAMLKNVTDISVAPGIQVELHTTPTHSIFPTERRITLVISHAPSHT